MAVSPTFGDVYRAYPKGSLAIYCDRTKKNTFLVIIGETEKQAPICKPVSPNFQHTDGAYVEYFQTETEDSTRVSISKILERAPDKYRPGVLCAVFQDSRRSVIAPGFGKTSPSLGDYGLPSLVCKLPPHPAEAKDEIRYKLWPMWGCSWDDLKFSTRSIERTDMPVLRGMVLAAVGLANPNWPPFIGDRSLTAKISDRACIKRGEVLLVRLPPRQEQIPFVAIGHDVINGTSARHALLLRTVDFEPGDERDSELVPLHAGGRISDNLGYQLVGRPLSVDVALIRGIRVLLGRNATQTGVVVSDSVKSSIDEKLQRSYG